MKTVQTTIYTAQELKELFPPSFSRALEKYRNSLCDIPWQDETIDSLKACIVQAGLTLRDYDLGAYHRSNGIRVEFGQDEAGELTGKRAITWLENNLFGQFRIPFKGTKRDSVRKYGKDYRPGRIAPCPLTGYCADEDYFDSLRKSVASGDTLKEAFEDLASVCAKLLESECEAQRTEEYFLDTAEANEWQFEEKGDRF